MSRGTMIDEAPKLTTKRLRQLLDYKPETGVFTHRLSHNGVNAGSIAGTVGTGGYRRISVDGKLYTAGRLAYLWMTGEWPPEEVDHINRIRDDNCWQNLRAVSSSQNKRNQKLSRQNDLPTGVHPKGNKFQAQISIVGRNRYLGSFLTPEDAAVAYESALQAVMPSSQGNADG